MSKAKITKTMLKAAKEALENMPLSKVDDASEEVLTKLDIPKKPTMDVERNLDATLDQVKPPKYDSKATEYKMSKEQINFPEHAMEGIAVYEINPIEFLKLTTDTPKQLNHILDNAKPLDFYNSAEARSIIHPFVKITPEGQIIGHEGRHRAASAYNAGLEKFKVAIVASESDYANKGFGWRWKRNLPLPKILKGQFRNINYKTDLSNANIIKRGE